ncbi:DUF1772 domain-containing protein [Streptomyces pactum]|uniref:DUF1772 domain-containing protein n=1 Tax=Streptomyces pactum TaxID=68249 RepID=A0ABS0NL77_9ACTN|nr:anthrone oxygenase family protein [Streptomyces pactum]MBH5335854.1 DUF1772 domain-containing protein [Streptomyces pactum]
MSALVRGGTLIAATVATGLSAGLFHAFACAVMPGLRKAGDRTFVETMQRINVAIVNGWFLATFLGALLLTGAAVVCHLPAGAGRRVLPWLIAALALYLAMFVITVAVNIPLNDELAAAGAVERIADPAAVRERFEAVWVRWNTVRAVLSAAAFACLTWALVLHGRTTG